MCTTNNEELGMRCKIHRMEDKLLRSKNPADQVEIQSILRTWRAQLQKIQWEKKKARGF